ncbi:MAG: chorismate-binding protein [Hallerella porci]|uniref:anthranilate synthase n=1 Tax=Hallerella porci TaxID=1945871 RepID=A0ABX5LII1_9BACT|nr:MULTISPECIES: chorismate-binding protein [Hallerella]MCI5601179.1 chorismate-binding protein [Hallerella sp.]MDY3922160.1 chorismate-binding protein [Hallerella porci]PWK92636.1 anthranilate synthase component 1 [Hallerella porci]
MTKRTDSVYLTLQGERYTPFSLAKKLGAKAILESASFSQGANRYSILMLEEAFHVIEDDQGVALLIGGERKPYAAKDILDALQEIASENEKPAKIPLPASGIGFLSYEFCARCDTIHLAKQRDDLNIPESEFVVGHVYIVFDHFTDTLHVFGLNYNEHEIDLQKAIAKIQKKLSNLDFSYLEAPEDDYPHKIITDLKKSHDEYVHYVEELKKHIIAGDIIQAVPSRRLQIESEMPALDVYRRLRTLNPSPYLLYLDFGAYQLVGSSPESLVRSRGGKSSIRPIAGTCRRGKNDAEDEYLKEKLSKDPKERAEHLMLVDLARNDLGRVCEPGTVHLTRNMECELFSHVIHIVSEVEGNTRSDMKPIQVLRSAFPAGTVSGAPKISAIEIVSSLESHKRNFYAGAVGYLDADGDLDFCIAIRCALKQGNIFTLQAGSGIVYASDPEREWEETNEKLGAMVQVLETK